MRKKVIGALLCTAMVASVLGGCGSKEEAKKDNSASNAASSSSDAGSDADSASALKSDGKVLNVYCWNDEFRTRVEAVYDKVDKTSDDGTITYLNETFSSTSEEKACDLTFNLLEKCEKTKAKVLFVTHQYKIFDEIHQTNIGFFTPVVTEGTENVRTYKIKKVEKKLLSYVNDILKKYGLTKEQLLKRKKI